MRELVCVTAIHTTLLYQQENTLKALYSNKSFKHSKMITYILLHLPTKIVIYSSYDKIDFYSICKHICDDVNYREIVSEEEEELPILDML